jgi:hypothetical protein
MIEFVNRNLEKTEPDYFYLVKEYVTTFGKDEGKNEPFSHERIFDGKDLIKCKTAAEKYYYEKLAGLEQTKYFLEFESPSNFVSGKNAAFNITLYLIEYYTKEYFLEHALIGEDDQTMAESREIEILVLKHKGLL